VTETLQHSLQISAARGEELHTKLKNLEQTLQNREADRHKLQTRLVELESLLRQARDEGVRNGELSALLERTEQRARKAEHELEQLQTQNTTHGRTLAEARHERDQALGELFALRRKLNATEKEFEVKLDQIQEAALKNKLQQMIRLQVLAPRVSVSIGGSTAVDLEGAPPAGQIRKVMMDKVLPRFSKVIYQETAQGARKAEDDEKTQQYVQKVMGEMVTSIEDKLHGVLGDKCVRTSY